MQSRESAHYEIWATWPGLGGIWKELCKDLGANACGVQERCRGDREPGFSQEPSVLPACAGPDKTGPAFLELRCWKESQVTTAQRKRAGKWWSGTKGQEEKQRNKSVPPHAGWREPPPRSQLSPLLPSSGRNRGLQQWLQPEILTQEVPGRCLPSGQKRRLTQQHKG